MAICKLRREASGQTKAANTLILDFQPLEYEKFLYLSHSVCGILLWQSEQTKIATQSLSKKHNETTEGNGNQER